MYISCPECNTSFMVLPEQIGPFGRKVKCSKCSNIWHQKLTENIRIEPIVSKVATPIAPRNVEAKFGSGINLPALLPIKIPQYLYTLPALLSTLIVFLIVILFQDSVGFRNLSNFSSLNVRDVHVKSDEESNKITVNYKIFNSSEHEMIMPLVRVRLFDKDQRLIKQHIADQKNMQLLPKQYINIKTEFPQVPNSAENIDITLGNMLDFILR